MVLHFNNDNDDGKKVYCRPDQIIPFVIENVNDNDLRKREEKRKKRFHFFISRAESQNEIEQIISKHLDFCLANCDLSKLSISSLIRIFNF